MSKEIDEAIAKERRRAFLPNPPGDVVDGKFAETRAFIQWKGTDICCDFYCDCGEQYHHDGDFTYAFHCPKCNSIWEMPSYVFPRKITPPRRDMCIQELKHDDDDDDDDDDDEREICED